MTELDGFAAINSEGGPSRGSGIADTSTVLKVMTNHGPLPALVVDHFGDTVGINPSADLLMGMIEDMPALVDNSSVNVIELLSEAGPAGWFSGWEKVLKIARQILEQRRAASHDDRAANLVGLIDRALDQVSLDCPVTFDARLPPYVELATNLAVCSVNWYVAIVPFRVDPSSEFDSIFLILLLPVDDDATEFARTLQTE